MDSIGGMLNHMGQMPKTHIEHKFVMFYWKKLMVYLFNGNHWNFYDGFYCLFLAGQDRYLFFTSLIVKSSASS